MEAGKEGNGSKGSMMVGEGNGSAGVERSEHNSSTTPHWTRSVRQHPSSLFIHSFKPSSEVSIWRAPRKRTSAAEHRLSKMVEQKAKCTQAADRDRNHSHSQPGPVFHLFLHSTAPPPPTHSHSPTPRTILAGGGVE